MTKLDSFTTGAARLTSGVAGAVSFWTGLAGRGAGGATEEAVFCASAGWDGEAEGTIWRSDLSGGFCSWMAEVSLTTRMGACSAPFLPCGSCPRSRMGGEAGCMAVLAAWRVSACVWEPCVWELSVCLACLVAAGRSWTGAALSGASEAAGFVCFACSSSALRSAMVCLRRSACAFLCSVLEVRVWVTLEVKSRTPSDTCVFLW